MSLPISRSALDRLGVELVEADDISDDLLARLAAILEVYQAVLDDVKRRLLRLGYQVHTRVKTTATLIEKLRRERKMRLSRVQDVAGARITVSNRTEQDQVTDTICTYFEAAGCGCRIVDRRSNPSHGYRAVHVIVRVDDTPVEIQIRTELQDSWAQIMERLGDQWGRGIRYGDDPVEPDRRVVAGGAVYSRREAIRVLVLLSDLIDANEATQAAAYNAGVTAERVRIVIEDHRGSFADPDAVADFEDRLEQQQAQLKAVAERQHIQEQRVRAILQDVADASDEEGDL